jgi:hypothetical protein
MDRQDISVGKVTVKDCLLVAEVMVLIYSNQIHFYFFAYELISKIG